MAKNSIADWSTTAAQNTDVGGVGITGNNLPSNLDDAMRTLMAQIKTDVWYTGNLVKTTSATDTTAGRMLKVGDFGLGTINNVPVLEDLNDATAPSGLYAVQVSSSGTFPAGASSGILLVDRYFGLFVRQIFTYRGGEARAGDTYIRVHNSTTSTWSLWEKIVYYSDIVGTVSQSSGVPTGSIIEKGSNSNGEYVRYADGTQICWNVTSNSSGAATATGSLFSNASDLTWTFPAAFNLSAGGIALEGNITRDDRIGGVTFRTPPSTTSTTYRYWTAVSLASPAAMGLRLMAIGRWF